jgi:tetratricopeptide (TPR) repeat protein
LGALALALAACASPSAQAGKQIRDDLATIRAERTPEKLAARGHAFATVGDYTRAEQYLAAAIDAGGDPAALLPELLRVCIVAKRYRVAIEYATPWIARYPADVKLRFLVAALRATTGDTAGAKADLQAVLATSPNDAPAHFAYAVLLRDQLGELLEADHEFREYIRLAPSGPHVEEARAALLKSVP